MTSPREASRVRLFIAAAALVLVATACMSPAQRATFDLVNQSRSQQRSDGLEWSPVAQQWAQQWAEHLASINQLAHSDLQALLNLSGARGAAENVGYASTIEGVHQSYMNSQPHRANILGDYTHLGTGVAQSNGRVFTVHVFLRY